MKKKSLSYKEISNVLIDSHCHLIFKSLYSKLDDVLKIATQHNVKGLLNISTNIEEIDTLLSISQKYKNIYHTIGIHPGDVQKYTIDQISQYLSQYIDNAVGIGETGFDLFHTKDYWEMQIKSFEVHAEYAKKFNLPMVLHIRNADEKSWEILQNWDIRCVLHCCTSHLNFVKKMLDRGAYVSFSGIASFNNALSVHELVKFVPIDRMLIETDAPFLAPEPFRGKPNQPSYVFHVAHAVANLKNLTFEEVCFNTTNNFLNLFDKFNLEISKNFY